MKYYRIGESFDQLVTAEGITLIANELFTYKELVKKCIPKSSREEVEVSQRNIYWKDGHRFEKK